MPTFPVELTGLVGFLDADPRARRAIAGLVGVSAADLGLAVVNAGALVLSHGSLGLVVDAMQRLNLLTEARSRSQVWVRVGGLWCASEATARATRPQIGPRPRDLSEGAVERYARLGLVGSVATAAISTLGGRPAPGFGAAAVAGVPKAGRLGREAFAGQLGRVLERRDVLVLDPEALRRLDRVDTVVLDRSVVTLKGIELVLDAAHAADLRLVLGADRAPRDGIEWEATAEPDLLREVRARQHAGAVVAVVSADDDSALLAADVAIGVAAGADHVPWTADLLCEANADDLALIVAATEHPRRVSKQSTLLAATSSVFGAIGMLFPMTRATGAHGLGRGQPRRARRDGPRNVDRRPARRPPASPAGG